MNNSIIFWILKKESFIITVTSYTKKINSNSAVSKTHIITNMPCPKKLFKNTISTVVGGWTNWSIWIIFPISSGWNQQKSLSYHHLEFQEVMVDRWRSCLGIPYIQNSWGYPKKKPVKKPILLAILCDLFGMVKWPFKGLSDLQLGDQKVTLNHLAVNVVLFFLSLPAKSPLVRHATGFLPWDFFSSLHFIFFGGERNPKRPWRKLTASLPLKIGAWKIKKSWTSSSKLLPFYWTLVSFRGNISSVLRWTFEFPKEKHKINGWFP